MDNVVLSAQDRPLIYSVPNLKVDNVALLEWYEKYVKNLPMALQASPEDGHYGGWSVLSYTGKVEDGWEDGSLAYFDSSGKPTKKEDKDKNVFRKVPASKYTVPTSIHVGAIVDTLEALKAIGFQLFRVRVAKLLPSFNLKWHIDSVSQRCWRLHIPLIIDEKCFFEYRIDGKVHSMLLPNDGRIFMVRTDLDHRVTHKGSIDRVHIVAMTSTMPKNIPGMI